MDRDRLRHRQTDKAPYSGGSRDSRFSVGPSLECRSSRFVGKAAKARAQGEGDFRRPALIRDCSGNVGFQVVSRPSPGDDKGPSRAGALIKLNFSFGSTTRIDGSSDSGRECYDEPTFRHDRRQCGDGRRIGRAIRAPFRHRNRRQRRAKCALCRAASRRPQKCAYTRRSHSAHPQGFDPPPLSRGGIGTGHRSPGGAPRLDPHHQPNHQPTPNNREAATFGARMSVHRRIPDAKPSGAEGRSLTLSGSRRHGIHLPYRRRPGPA